MSRGTTNGSTVFYYSLWSFFITSLFKKSLDARQKMAYLMNSKLPSRHFAIGHGGYLTFCLAGCGRLFGANFDLVPAINVER